MNKRRNEGRHIKKKKNIQTLILDYSIGTVCLVLVPL